ncbi:hypothetical protein D9756_002606 [Leucocoprinus leucothites]|uniref:C2H2-type domain-containing protein n=1 Tax=Leucocoprinus leucothites TaxID=201217 RepID=A0A8H5GC69_9AGAR|nr:hypothetical protein D9756_002606 [Leucoagaricus leucothites]
MAQSLTTTVTNSSEHLVACAGMVTGGPESIIELSKNTLRPVRCEWGAGTKTECDILLGSWALLRKHLHIIHCHAVDKDGFFCALPRCNQQFHPSYITLVEHIDTAHLSCLMFYCPISGCQVSPLRGLESLKKHVEAQHSNNMEILPHQSRTDPSIMWMPFEQSQLLANGSKSALVAPGCSITSDLPRNSEPGLGTIFVSEMGMRKSHKMMGWMQESTDEWLPSQPTMSQSQGPVGNWEPHPMTRRKRIRAKQLEKVKEVMKEEEEEGVVKVILDDITRFGDQGDSMGIVEGGVNGLRVSIRGQGLVSLRRSRWQQEVKHKDHKLIQKADSMVIIGQGMKQIMADLSRPQPMLALEELARDANRYPRLMRVPKGITFDIMKSKMDKLEAMGVVDIDPDRLLYDLSL